LVQADDLSLGSFNEDIVRDVLRDAGLSPNHHESADTAELMNADAAADVCPIVHLYVTAEHHIVHQDHVVPYFAVVSDVSPDHNQVAVADRGYRFIGVAAVESSVLANAIVIANDELATRVHPLQVLSGSAKDRSFPNLVAAAEQRAALDDDAGFESAVVADDNAGFDNGEWSDVDVAPQLRGGIDKGRWVDVGHGLGLTWQDHPWSAGLVENGQIL
jgi:hypothetical protein